jgi:hypothetical protein
MRDALLLRRTSAGVARLECRACDVPLQQMNASAARVREMRELMDQETLASAGQAREEHAPRAARERLERAEQRRALAQLDAFG